MRLEVDSFGIKLLRAVNIPRKESSSVTLLGVGLP